MKNIFSIVFFLLIWFPAYSQTVDSVMTAVDAEVIPNKTISTVGLKSVFSKLNNRSKAVESKANTRVDSLKNVVAGKANSTDVATTYATKGELSTTNSTITSKLDAATAATTYATKGELSTTNSTITSKLDAATAATTYATKTDVTAIQATSDNVAVTSTYPTVAAAKVGDQVLVTSAQGVTRTVWNGTAYESDVLYGSTPPSSTVGLVDNTKAVWKKTGVSVIPTQSVDYSLQNGVWRPVTPLTSLSYGADNTGVTDATAAIQKQLDELDEVIIPEGTYRIDGTLIIQRLWQKVTIMGKLIRKAANSSSTAPVVQFKYQRGSLSSTANATIESENNSPDGIILIGTQNLTGIVTQANLLWNQIAGLNIRGNSNIASVGIKMNSTEAFTGNYQANYCNTIRNNMIENVGIGVLMLTNCNGNMISDNQFMAIKKYAIQMDGTFGDGAGVLEVMINGVFVHQSPQIVAIVDGKRASYCNVLNLHGEPGGGQVFVYDALCNNNVTIGTDNTPNGYTDAGENWNVMSGYAKFREVVTKNIKVSTDASPNSAIQFGQDAKPFRIKQAKQYSTQNPLLGYNINTNPNSDEYVSAGGTANGIEFDRITGDVKIYAMSNTSAGTVYYAPNNPLTVKENGIAIKSITAATRDAMTSVPDGMQIYNSTMGQFEYREAGAWLNHKQKICAQGEQIVGVVGTGVSGTMTISLPTNLNGTLANTQLTSHTDGSDVQFWVNSKTTNTITVGYKNGNPATKYLVFNYAVCAN